MANKCLDNHAAGIVPKKGKDSISMNLSECLEKKSRLLKVLKEERCRRIENMSFLEKLRFNLNMLILKILGEDPYKGSPIPLAENLSFMSDQKIERPSDINLTAGS